VPGARPDIETSRPLNEPARRSREGLFIFVIGRPGSGKSEFIRRAARRLTEEGTVRRTCRVDDCSKLWDIFRLEESSGEWKRCRKMPGGGYRVTDPSVWDELLRAVAREVGELETSSAATFVEFSRASYAAAFKNFSPDLLRRSVVAYVDCSFDTCWRRNLQRSKSSEGQDRHFVSREEMESTYRRDDREEFLRQSPAPVFVVDNESDGTEHLQAAAEVFAGKLRDVGKAGGTS